MAHYQAYHNEEWRVDSDDSDYEYVTDDEEDHEEETIQRSRQTLIYSLLGWEASIQTQEDLVINTSQLSNQLSNVPRSNTKQLKGAPQSKAGITTDSKKASRKWSIKALKRSVNKVFPQVQAFKRRVGVHENVDPAMKDYLSRSESFQVIAQNCNY